MKAGGRGPLAWVLRVCALAVLAIGVAFAIT